MPAPDLYPLVDRLVPGGLASFLSVAAERGDSNETIARLLFTQHDVSVSAETVRRWRTRAAVGAA